jgi:hypothetical protein
MIILYTLLIAVGSLPLLVFLLKRRSYRHILHTGTKTTAEISHIRTQRYYKGGTYDRVLFIYLPAGAGRYVEGQFNSKVGKYKRGEQLDIFYLPQHPTKHAVPGSQGELFFLIFTIAILLFVLFACYKINQMLQQESISYDFQLPALH